MRWFHGPWWAWPWPAWFFYQQRLWRAWQQLPRERQEAHRAAWRLLATGGKVSMWEAADALSAALASAEQSDRSATE